MRVELRKRWSVLRSQPAKCSTQSHHSPQDSKNTKASAAQALIFRAAAIRRSNVQVQHIIKRMNAPPPTQTPQGQPCLTGVGNNPLTVTKHSQRAASRMPKARRSRLSLTRRAGCATLPDHKQYPSRPSPKSSLKEWCCHLSICADVHVQKSAQQCSHQIRASIHPKPLLKLFLFSPFCWRTILCPTAAHSPARHRQ